MDVRIEPHVHYLHVHVSGEYKDPIPEQGQPSFIVEACQKHRLTRILMDARELEGEIGILTRYWRGTRFADAFLGSTIRTAVVGNAKQVDIQPFFETVARNRGVTVKVFTDLDAAMVWLAESTTTKE
jgi:hypothetical protein